MSAVEEKQLGAEQDQQRCYLLRKTQGIKKEVAGKTSWISLSKKIS
jgi:hypothetical protein